MSYYACVNVALFLATFFAISTRACNEWEFNFGSRVIVSCLVSLCLLLCTQVVIISFHRFAPSIKLSTESKYFCYTSLTSLTFMRLRLNGPQLVSFDPGSGLQQAMLHYCQPWSKNAQIPHTPGSPPTLSGKGIAWEQGYSSLDSLEKVCAVSFHTMVDLYSDAMYSLPHNGQLA